MDLRPDVISCGLAAWIDACRKSVAKLLGESRLSRWPSIFFYRSRVARVARSGPWVVGVGVVACRNLTLYYIWFVIVSMCTGVCVKRAKLCGLTYGSNVWLLGYLRQLSTFWINLDSSKCIVLIVAGLPGSNAACNRQFSTGSFGARRPRKTPPVSSFFSFNLCFDVKMSGVCAGTKWCNCFWVCLRFCASTTRIRSRAGKDALQVRTFTVYNASHTQLCITRTFIYMCIK